MCMCVHRVCRERERERELWNPVLITPMCPLSVSVGEVCVCVCVFVGSHPAACDISGKAEERLQRLSH